MSSVNRDDQQLLDSDSDDDDYVPVEPAPASRPSARGGKKKPGGGLVLEQDQDDTIPVEEEQISEEEREDRDVQRASPGICVTLGKGTDSASTKDDAKATKDVFDVVAKVHGNGLVNTAEKDKRKSSANVDDIWASMNRPIKSKAPRARRNSSGGKTDPALAGWLGTPISSSSNKRPRAPGLDKQVSKTASTLDKSINNWLASSSGQPIVQPPEGHRMNGSGDDTTRTSGGSISVVQIEHAAAPADDEDGSISKHPKNGPSTGLENLLRTIKGDKGPKVIDKTREAWTTFKKSDAEVADELEAYKKDKNRYTDKVAFLDRAEVREWQADMDRKRKR